LTDKIKVGKGRGEGEKQVAAKEPTNLTHVHLLPRSDFVTLSQRRKNTGLYPPSITLRRMAGTYCACAIEVEFRPKLCLSFCTGLQDHCHVREYTFRRIQVTGQRADHKNSSMLHLVLCRYLVALLIRNSDFIAGPNGPDRNHQHSLQVFPPYKPDIGQFRMQQFGDGNSNIESILENF